MAERTPLVRVSGYLRDLPAGDTVAGASGGGWTITAAAGNYTILASESGTIFTNTGMGASRTYTLPASAGCTAGVTHYRICVLDPAYTLNIDLPGSDTLVFFSERNLTSYIASTGVPAYCATATGYEYMDVIYMGGGVWHGQPIGNWAA